MQAQLNKKHMTAAAERQGNHQASDEGQPAAQQGDDIAMDTMTSYGGSWMSQ